jgi:hypothetical protein
MISVVADEKVRHLPETKLIVGFYGTLGDQEPPDLHYRGIGRESTKNFLASGSRVIHHFFMYHVDRLAPSRHLRKGKIVNPEVAPVFT